MNAKTLKTFFPERYSVRSQAASKGPVRFIGIAEKAGNHRNDRKFRKSHQLLNQTKRDITRLCLRKVSCQMVVRIKFPVNSAFLNLLYGTKRKPQNAGKQKNVF